MVFLSTSEFIFGWAFAFRIWWFRSKSQRVCVSHLWKHELSVRIFNEFVWGCWAPFDSTWFRSLEKTSFVLEFGTWIFLAAYLHSHNLVTASGHESRLPKRRYGTNAKTKVHWDLQDLCFSSSSFTKYLCRRVGSWTQVPGCHQMPHRSSCLQVPPKVPGSGQNEGDSATLHFGGKFLDYPG